MKKLSKNQKVAIGTAAAVLAGGAAFLLTRKASASTLTPPDDPYKPDEPAPDEPAHDDPTFKRGESPIERVPGGPPPYGNACRTDNRAYDRAYWDAGGTATARERIFTAFERLGYSTPDNRDTMNRLGPNGVLGGGDDVPNKEVRRFQEDYNIVSKAGNLLPGMGGLDIDGLVGPCTINALKLLLDNLADPAIWPAAVVSAEESL